LCRSAALSGQVGHEEQDAWIDCGVRELRKRKYGDATIE
jgi:hypothetical protein